MKHFAEPSCDGTQLWAFNALREFNRCQAFADVLACIDDGDVIAERDHHLGETKLRYGSAALKAGESADGQFDGEGDLLLNLVGAERRRNCVDLHLHWSRIRKCIDRELDKTNHSGPAGHGEREQHD